jgi:hypothetical protein
LINAASIFSLAAFRWMQGKYRERCDNGVSFLNSYDLSEYSIDLKSLGIIPGEHRRIIGLWTSTFTVFLFAMLATVWIYQFQGWCRPVSCPTQHSEITTPFPQLADTVFPDAGICT